MTTRWTRRTLLKRTGAAVGALAATGALKGPFVLAERSPNSKLQTAVIGCGGQGGASVGAAASEKLVAMCDVDDGRLAAAVKGVIVGGARPQTFCDYRKMFDAMAKDIDVVFVATPDHHHAPAAMRAIALGKHVFCEKPLCHDISQARALAAAAKKQKVITLMGNQGHCAEGYRRLCEYIWAGAIGDVTETHSWNYFENGGDGGRPASKPVPAGLHWDEWLGPMPVREYHDGLHPASWRSWWDFGTGGLGDWGCHNMDGVFWALKTAAPTSVEAVDIYGGSDEMYPRGNTILWNVPAREDMPAMKAYWHNGIQLNRDNLKDDKGATPKTVNNYPPMLADLEKKAGRNFRQGWNGGTFYIGTKGVMHTGSYGESPRILPEEAMKALPPPKQDIPRIKGSHFQHFLQCCKDNTPTCAGFEYAAALTEFLLLGHLAMKAGVGTKVEWDASAGRCTNLPDLNRWVNRGCRKGWEV
jgi:predicted dehydrogenase